MAEGRLPDRRLAGHHRQHKGSEERDRMVSAYREQYSENSALPHAVVYCRAVGGEQEEGTDFLRGGWLVEMGFEGRPFSSEVQAAPEVCNSEKSKRLRWVVV